MSKVSFCSNWMLRKTSPAIQNFWSSWKSSLHSSVICASSDASPRKETPDLPSLSTENPPHTPVMLDEVLHHLDIKPGQVVLDMTFGGGGHSKAILSRNSKVTVLALDRDPAAVVLARQLEKEHSGRVKPMLGRFSELESLFADMNVKPGSVDGVLLDAGCSSMQMDEASRGFSLSKDGPLDMRMDGERYPDMACAADVVNTLDQQALTSILTAYGEERNAWKVASAIVKARRINPITRTQQLAYVIGGSFPAAVLRARKDRLHRPAHIATKSFQALRIFVNDELRELHAGLRAAQAVLRPGGCLCVLTFHSLEDRLVKRFLQGDDLSKLIESHFSKGTLSKAKEKSAEGSRAKKSLFWTPLVKKVITPDRLDVENNPRGRSSKLRVAVRL